MAQPALGIVSSAIVIAVSLSLIALWDFDTAVGWGSWVLMCMIPMQLVVGVAWGANPGFAAKLAQPLKGAVLTLICAASAGVMAPLYLQWAGGGELLPQVILATITSVIYTFTLTIMFGGWPFRLVQNQLVSGVLLWAGALSLNFALTRWWFDFGFLEGTPVYQPALDPGGWFNAEAATVFHVTYICGLFLLLHFDLWPLGRYPALMQQPVLGMVWVVVSLLLGAVLYGLGVNLLGWTPMGFLIRGPVPFIFGTIIVLNMLHNSLFAKLEQPAKGLANTAAALLIGNGLAYLYRLLSPLVTGPMAEGPPTSDFERWLASALLGVTFPLLIFYAEFFKMWPLVGGFKKTQEAAAR
jgi:hypothetical protein